MKKIDELSKKYELANVVEAMNEYPELVIGLGGHTDNTGDAEANMLLSQQRAEAVRDYLVANGVPADRLVATGYGQNDPLGDNSTEAGREKNRRTEFTVLAGGLMADVETTTEESATEETE